MEDKVEKIVSMKPVKLISVASEMEADMIVDFLENNGIQSFKKQEGSGSYMNIYLGFSVYGAKIYVDQQDYQTSLELLNEINLVNVDTNIEEVENISNVEETQKKLDDVTPNYPEASTHDENTDKTYPFYRNPRYIARIYLGVFIGTGIIIFILGKVIGK